MSQRNVSSKSTKLVFAFQIVVCSLFRSLSALTYLIALALSLLVFCQNAHPAQITMTWDPNNEPDLAGYKVYYGSSSRNYEVFADVGNQTTCTLSDLEEGQTFYLAATAYDVTGNESDYSEELTYYVPKVNTPPIASSSTLTTMQDTIVTGTLSTSDPDGDPLTFSLITTGGIGTATLTNATAGVFTYAPNPNATGIDTFTFKANDGTADSNTAEVTITITPPRDTDGDGISDEDETDLYGTDPNKVDTDEDGLADGEELAFWGDDWGADYDGDNLINLLDPDADGDGSLDGIKIDQGSDPADSISRLELPPLEIGEVSVDHTWSRVAFNRSFVDPIVVAKPLSLNDDAPAVVRVCNVDETGFEIRIQEWDYLDGTHAVETVSYLVMERGGYTLADGIRVEAGTFETSTTSSFGAVSFSQSFEKVPVVITAVSSFNETNAITGRLRNITTQGFEFRRQGQELTPGVYGTQTISYIAWEPSSGMLGGLTFEVNSTDDVVRHDFHTILFDQPFVSIPVFLADMQTTDGGNTANLRWKNKDLYGVSVQIDEEQSKNRETNHTTEMVGYMAFAKKAP